MINMIATNCPKLGVDHPICKGLVLFANVESINVIILDRCKNR